MFEDGITGENAGDRLKVMDIAEVVSDRLVMPMAATAAESEGPRG